jgi:hypothetical protein
MKDKDKPDPLYQTADALDERIVECTAEAHQYPASSKECQTILKEIARLRLYAEAKRWIESPRLKSGRR